MGPLPHRLALRLVVPRHGVPRVCVASPAWWAVGVGPGPWLIVVAFATAASYFPHLRRWCLVPSGEFLPLRGFLPIGRACVVVVGRGFHIHAVPPPLGSRRRPWPPYPALGWGWSVRGFHPTTGQSSSLLAIRPIGGLRFVSMGRGWGVSAIASFATSALGSGVVRRRVGRDKKARNGARHASCSVSVTHRAGLPLRGSPLLFPPLLLPPRSVR